MNNKLLTQLAVGLAAVVAVLKLIAVYNQYSHKNLDFDDRTTSQRGSEFNVPSKEYTDLLKAGDGFISYMRVCQGQTQVRSVLNYVKLKNPDPNRYVLDMTYRYNTKGAKDVGLTQLLKYLDQVSTEHYYQSIQNGVGEVLLGQNSEQILKYTVPTSQQVLEENFGIKLAPEFCKRDGDFNNRSLHSTPNEYIMQAFNMAKAGKEQLEVTQDNENPNRIVLTMYDTSKSEAVLAAFYETMPTVQEYFYTYTTKTGKFEKVYGAIFERNGIRIDYSYSKTPQGANASLSFFK